MINKVLFRDRQEAQAADFNNLQDYAQGTIDGIVADAITDDARYKGLTVAQNSGTEVSVGVGRLYDGGRVYHRDVSSIKNLLAELPASQQKIVTVVAYGQTVETGVEPRDFLINLEDETTEPQSVAMREERRCEIGYLSGSEGVSPAAPSVGAGQVKVADVLLGPAGIISITMSADTRLGGLEGANANIRALRDWRQIISPRVDALQSTVADVRGELATRAPMSRVISMDRNVSALWRLLGLPSGVTGKAEDEFVEGSQTDDAFAGDEAYHLDEGLHFPSADSATAALDLFNAIDSTVKKSGGGWVLPAHSHDPALATAGATGEINLSSYTVTTTDTKRYTTTKTKRVTKTRKVRKRQFEHRDKGWTFLQDDKGESVNGVPFGTQQNIEGLAKGGWDYKGDTYETEKYTTTKRVPVTRNRTVTSTNTVTGMTLAQTMLSPRAMWLTKIGLNFSDLDASGDVTVLVTRATAGGRPDREDVLSETTVNHADLAATGETPVPIEPAYVEAGERIALVLVTNGAHRHRTVTGVEDTQGTVFYGSDTGWQHTEDGKSLLFTVYAAKFARTSTEVRLGDVNLSGGVTDLVIETEELEPAGTRLEFEYQHNGVWHPLAKADTLVANMPSTVPLRAIMTGTTNVQPAFLTGAGRVEASIADTSLVHYSVLHALSAGSNEVYVDLDVHWYEDAEESVTVELLDADNGDAVIAAASTTAVEAAPIYDRAGVDTGMEERKVRFAFTPTGLQNFRVKITGSTGGAAQRPFAIAERVTSWVI